MRPPRFRLRTLMIAVAVVGILAGLWRRQVVFWRIAETHRLRGNTYAFVIEERIHPMPESEWPPIDRWHAEMARKYARASRYPFLPVWPDPPEPE